MTEEEEKVNSNGNLKERERKTIRLKTDGILSEKRQASKEMRSSKIIINRSGYVKSFKNQRNYFLSSILPISKNGYS